MKFLIFNILKINGTHTFHVFNFNQNVDEQIGADFLNQIGANVNLMERKLYLPHTKILFMKLLKLLLSIQQIMQIKPKWF